MIRRSILLFSILLLSGCGTLEAHRARTNLLNVTEPDIMSCMGAPDKIQYVSPHHHVLEWVYVQTGTDVDLKFGMYGLALGRPGICHVTMREDNGITTGVHFQYANVGPTNPDSICGRMVQECVDHREQTPLPADFDSDGLIIGPKDLAKH